MHPNGIQEAFQWFMLKPSGDLKKHHRAPWRKSKREKNQAYRSSWRCLQRGRRKGVTSLKVWQGTKMNVVFLHAEVKRVWRVTEEPYLSGRLLSFSVWRTKDAETEINVGLMSRYRNTVQWTTVLMILHRSADVTVYLLAPLMFIISCPHLHPLSVD